MGELAKIVEAQQINERLETLYGLHTIKSLPNFRVIWGAAQYEKRRISERDVYTDSGIWLRKEYNVIDEVPKYPDWKECWILERLIPNCHTDVFDGDFIYEPLWVFNEGLELSYRAINLVMAHVLRKVEDPNKPKNQKDCDYL